MICCHGNLLYVKFVLVFFSTLYLRQVFSNLRICMITLKFAVICGPYKGFIAPTPFNRDGQVKHLKFNSVILLQSIRDFLNTLATSYIIFVQVKLLPFGCQFVKYILIKI